MAAVSVWSGCGGWAGWIDFMLVYVVLVWDWRNWVMDGSCVCVCVCVFVCVPIRNAPPFSAGPLRRDLFVFKRSSNAFGYYPCSATSKSRTLPIQSHPIAPPPPHPPHGQYVAAHAATTFTWPTWAPLGTQIERRLGRSLDGP